MNEERFPRPDNPWYKHVRKPNAHRPDTSYGYTITENMQKHTDKILEKRHISCLKEEEFWFIYLDGFENADERVEA